MKQLSRVEKPRVIRKVYFVLFFIAVNGNPRTKKCLIQSYYRAKNGSGLKGTGNLLRVGFPFGSNSNRPSQVSFTGSCSDSPAEIEFQLILANRNGTLVITLRLNANTDYVLAVRNQALVIEHLNKTGHDHEFVYSCVSKEDCEIFTLKSFKSPSYVKTDENGNPLVGSNPLDVTAWFQMLDNNICTPRLKAT
ncbi:hypothetical protein pdam_00008430 [Pocillopora damicornis]|uniref:Uncharacterized protein n=1 Tax=Pocillopora damicornis TaxID=46731 RepID=A0A3M6TW65_POCDA|nr:uncharacterized protein LOC113672415 [Pocillopora damicornis]RMX45524.1 hypothetical protein pdam_00008430 [Pocillopora damicornis]